MRHLIGNTVDGKQVQCLRVLHDTKPNTWAWKVVVASKDGEILSVEAYNNPDKAINAFSQVFERMN